MRDDPDVRREGRSVYVDLPELGQAVRVGVPEDKEDVDYDGLRERVGDELFARATRPKGYELIPSEWEKMMEEELVTRSDLLDFVSTKPATPPVEVVTL